jgi:hypothetical protein
MNIKLKAAMDTAVVVGTCLVGATAFGLALHYIPAVALIVAIGALTYFVYKMNLSDLEMKEKYPSIYEEKK